MRRIRRDAHCDMISHVCERRKREQHDRSAPGAYKEDEKMRRAGECVWSVMYGGLCMVGYVYGPRVLAKKTFPFGCNTELDLFVR